MHVNNAALSKQVIRAGLVTGLKTACSWMSDMWCRVLWYTETVSSVFRMEEEFFSPVSIAKHYCIRTNSPALSPQIAQTKTLLNIPTSIQPSKRKAKFHNHSTHIATPVKC